LATANNIYTLEELRQKVEAWKADNVTVVFTNGVFDLLHLGHITYLKEAASLGQRLIVGVNSDESVLSIKGPSRPIKSEETRATILAALQMVDAIVIFDQDTPLDIISTLLPDVLVKGGDYTIDNIVGASEVLANGGQVMPLKFIEGHSSTDIINKIRKHG